ncbi:MAG: hypothetical protein R3B12_05350 [Candidatus Saccharimonadales bacterium]
MKNQKGITAVVVLLAVLTVVVGFAGYYVYNMQKDKKNPRLLLQIVSKIIPRIVLLKTPRLPKKFAQKTR